MVREFVNQEFGVSLSEVSDGQLVVDWMSSDLPRIQRMAKKVGASVYFGDESSIRSDYHSGTTWAERGKTPTIKTSGARFRFNMISAVNARGTLRFMITEENLTADVFIEFLKGLLHDEEHPVFLIVDQHAVHKSKKVRQYVADTKGRLRIFYLPPYSPELNPDEQVWNHIKRHGIGRMIITGLSGLKEMVIARFRLLQQAPEIVRGFFRHPIIKTTMMFANQ